MSRPIRFMTATYEKREDGYSVPEPVLHVFGRDSYYNRRHVVVDGFRAYFCTSLEEALQHSDELSNDHRVRRVETEEDGEPIQSLRGVRLAKIYTVMPYHVSDLREQFNETWEADVLFPDRFAYDVGITDGFRVTKDGYTDGDVVSVDHIEPTEDDLSVPPRLLYLDIEVKQSEDGPSVVSEKGRELAENPITAITTYDAYTDEYVAHVLAHDAWTHTDYERASTVRDSDEIDVSVNVYESEWTLLSKFADCVSDHRPDVLLAWNIGFDLPYLVNRYFTLDHMDVFKLSDTRSVESMDGSGRFMNGDVEGPILLDLLTAYEKAQIHELDDSSLETVAAAETDMEKLDVDEQQAWVDDPEDFVRYSIRDVEAMTAINREVGVI